jgi:hypothetical protein
MQMWKTHLQDSRTGDLHPISSRPCRAYHNATAADRLQRRLSSIVFGKQGETDMETHGKNCSFAVFPFLKTRDKVSIGGLTFRSTEDTDGLTHEQTECVREISEMLFLQDNLRIKSASYAALPFVDLTHEPIDLQNVRNVQSVVAYCYALPRHEFGDLFLSSEHASMAILTPSKVSIYLVRPDFHVDVIGPASGLGADEHGQVDGYAGLYNFRHYFWAAKGSRLYGPRPHITLNHSQSLCIDLARFIQGRTDYRLLIKLLEKPDTSSSLRIFTALRWFNEANKEANEQSAAIVNLSIAFEALLSLPIDEKTDRLTDAISLLLGRIPRLDIWARQFYDARSQIVHEGDTQRLRFVPAGSQKKNESPMYQSLISYGRQIFQLCLGTLLTGIELAENAGLEDKLITNQERFQKICMVLSDESIGARERLERTVPIVAAIRQYRYVPETGLQIEAMLGATRSAAKTLLEENEVASDELREQLRRFSTAERTNAHFWELDALRGLHDIFQNKSTVEMECSEPVRDLVDVVWNYVFMHYFWIKEHIIYKKPKTGTTETRAEPGGTPDRR